MNLDDLLRLPRRVSPRREPGRYPTPAGADPSEYTDAESEFIRAVARFKDVNRVNTPTLVQLLWVARQIGYRRAAAPEAAAEHERVAYALILQQRHDRALKDASDRLGR